MKPARLIIGFLILSSSLHFRANAEDTLKIFPFRDFYNIVLNNHPLVKQASTLSDVAKSELRVARGNFDPTYDFDFTQKVFKNTTYYNYFDNGLKVPLWFGPDIKSGFEQNSGLLVNPTNFTPPEGLWYVGLEVPIGQKMIMDERRAIVKQSKYALQIAEADKIKLINKILLNAAKDYWEWYYQYERYKTNKEGYALAQIRYEGIKKRAEIGDLATIDSIEAFAIMQDRWIEYQKAFNDFQNSGIALSNYLWTDDEKPLEIENLIPQEASIGNTINDATVQQLNSNANQSHPDLIKMNYKIRQLEIDKKLKQNNLFPQFVIGAKYLSTPERNLLSDLNYDYMSNNYKVTLSLYQPIFIRKERGKYQLSKIKLQQAFYEQQITTREISNAVSSAYNDVVLYREMVQTQESVSKSYQRLFEGEKSKFEIGESNLFMVNSRENKMIEAKLKIAELKSKLEKSIALLYWSAGNFNLN